MPNNFFYDYEKFKFENYKNKNQTKKAEWWNIMKYYKT